jgi:hypothetical protein
VRPGFDQTVEQSLRIIGDEVSAYLRNTAERSVTGRGE